MFTRALSTVILTFTLLIAATSALAVTPTPNNRSFVSTKGLDTNPCTPTAPCRLFAAAINITNDGGEVVVLDSGGFGAPLNITKSITLVAPAGVYAGFAISSGTAVTINTPGISVILKGLNFTSTGSGTSGIEIFDASEVTIDNCTFNNLQLNAINVAPVNIGTKVTVTDSSFIKNNYGIKVNGNGQVAVSHSKFFASQSIAVWAVQYTPSTVAKADIIDTVFTGNYVAVWGNGSVIINANRIAANDGDFGLGIEGSAAIMTLSNSIATGNTYEDLYQVSGAIFNSTGNNVARLINGTITNDAASLLH